MGSRVFCLERHIRACIECIYCFDLQSFSNRVLFGRARLRMTELQLARQWEAISTVRKRFRLGCPWLHFPQADDGSDCVQCTRSVQANYKILLPVVTAAELQKVNLKTFQDEATWWSLYVTSGEDGCVLFWLIRITLFLSQVRALFKQIGYVQKEAKEDYIDAWALKNLYGYSWRRYADSIRRGQTPREPRPQN